MNELEKIMLISIEESLFSRIGEEIIKKTNENKTSDYYPLPHYIFQQDNKLSVQNTMLTGTNRSPM